MSQYSAPQLCLGCRTQLYMGHLQRHSPIIFQVVIHACVFVAPRRMHIVPNMSMWLQNNDSDSHNHPHNELNYFIITPGLCVHSLCQSTPIKEFKSCLNSSPGHQKIGYCIMEKTHALEFTSEGLYFAGNWFNLFDSFCSCGKEEIHLI